MNFECRRFIVAHIGYYVTEMLDTRKVHGVWYAVLRGDTQQFRLPVSRQHNHPFDIYHYKDNPYSFEKVLISRQDATLAGQLRTLKDVLAKEIQIEAISIGDIIVFEYAGAYGWSVPHHDFLGHPYPEFIYLAQTKGDE